MSCHNICFRNASSHHHLSINIIPGIARPSFSYIEEGRRHSCLHERIESIFPFDGTVNNDDWACESGGEDIPTDIDSDNSPPPDSSDDGSPGPTVPLVSFPKFSIFQNKLL